MGTFRIHVGDFLGGDVIACECIAPINRNEVAHHHHHHHRHNAPDDAEYVARDLAVGSDSTHKYRLLVFDILVDLEANAGDRSASENLLDATGASCRTGESSGYSRPFPANLAIQKGPRDCGGRPSHSGSSLQYMQCCRPLETGALAPVWAKTGLAFMDF